MKNFVLKVSKKEAGMRLDLFLIEFFNKKKAGISRTFIKKLILEGKVILHEEVLKKPHYKVKETDEFKVSVEEKDPDTLDPEDISLDVIYEDEDLAIINKQCGLVVHPAAGNKEHTLVNALLYRLKNLSDINPHRPGIVHRLDKDTSGLMVVAKNNFAHLDLAKQFSEHTIVRQYVAIVRGRVQFDENIIELPITRHPFKRKNMSVGFGENAKYAKTYYRTLKRTAEFSLLSLKPFTGRTHQLRVHLSFIGHPILGDEKYAKNNDFSRLALHAQYIGFIHPRTKKFIDFSTEIPSELRNFINKNKT